jgi:hypothetical protein
VNRIVWRMQAMREGDLSERARRRAIELADDAEIRLSAPRTSSLGPGTVSTAAFESGRSAAVPRPGSVIRREYKGRRIVVRVLPRAFEYEGASSPCTERRLHPQIKRRGIEGGQATARAPESAPRGWHANEASPTNRFTSAERFESTASFRA